MAHFKVGVYRRYLEPPPKDAAGRLLPKDSWPKKRAFCWVARWFGANGKRFGRSFSTKKQAQAFAWAKENQLQAYRPGGRPQISLRDFYIEHKHLAQGTVAPGTLCLHLSTMERLIDLLGPDRPIDSISHRDIELFRANRLADGIAPTTTNKDLAILRRMFNLAILRGYLPKAANPTSGVAKMRVCPARMRLIDPQQLGIIYSSVDDICWRALLVTLYTTGLRLREATNLTWQDIDSQTHELFVTRKKTGGYVQAWRPKDYQIRQIPLAVQAANLLAALQAVAPEGCPYVFMQKARWDYYRNRIDCGKWKVGTDLIHNLLKRFKSICLKAGVGHYTLHDLRRSCITNWARRLPIYVVQQLAGHSDIRTTQRYYLVVGQEDLERAREVQNLLLEPVCLGGS